MLRTSRHAKILEIISRQEIETQDELCEELSKVNYVVTQATVSRDIRDLHLFKVAGLEKKYRYTYINTAEGEVSTKMKNLFRDSVLTVRKAQNIVVIKTMTGNGTNAGLVIDKLQYPEVVGTVAGDDTLIMICEDNDAAMSVIGKVEELLK